MRLVVVLLAFATCRAMVSPLAPLITKAAEDRVDGRYLIQLKRDTDVDIFISKLTVNFFEEMGGQILDKFGALNAFYAVLEEAALDLVRSQPQVEFVEEDSLMYAMGTSSWGIDRIDQPGKMDGEYDPDYSGKGVHIYIIDTGVNIHHEDINERASVAYDSVYNENNLERSAPLGYGIDCHGHGSHCAATAAGTDFGVAREANVYAVRVLTCLGLGTVGNIISGCNWVAENAIRPAVASMSLGGAPSNITDNAVRGMWESGVAVAVAAGNSDRDACTASPAREKNSICVGASDSEDKRAYFSNYGTCVDVYAPGVDITSAWADCTDCTYVASGTSMACPHVAGAMALVYHEFPEHTTEQVKLHIKNLAHKCVTDDPVITGTRPLLQVKSSKVTAPSK